MNNRFSEPLEPRRLFAAAIGVSASNSQPVADNDTTPSAVNLTDFDYAAVNGGSVTHTFRIRKLSSDTLLLTGNPKVRITGTHAADFQVVAQPASPVPSGGGTTFQVKFDPTAAGIRTATVVIASNDPDNNPYNFSIKGIGTSPLTGTAPRLYGHEEHRRLFVVNPATGQTQIIGKMNVDPFDIAFDEAGNLYGAVAENSQSSILYRINPVTAAATQVGRIGGFVNALVYAPGGGLHGAGSSFFRINTSTGQGTVIGSLGNGRRSAGDLAYDLRGNLYLTVDAFSGSSGDVLTRINRTTGAATPIGTGTGFQDVFGMAYGPNGVMYGLCDGPNVIAISLTTGRATRVATMDSKVGGPGGASFTTEPKKPEVEVRGNNVVIADGDTTPASADHTLFGAVRASSGTITRTFTVRNTGGGVLGLIGSPKVNLSGANAGDFTVITQPAGVTAPGGSTTFQVRFDAKAVGTRSATVSIVNNDPSENPYNFTIRGTGLAGLTAVPGPTAIPADAGSPFPEDEDLIQ